MRRCHLFISLICLLASALPAGAEAPPDRYEIDANGTVHDTRTKLTWQRALSDKVYTQLEAVDYCAGLATAGGGWRLPTISEVITLVDPTTRDPAVDTTAFPDTSAYDLWTSSPAVGSPGFVWVASFTDGGRGVQATAYRGLLVRCVRR